MTIKKDTTGKSRSSLEPAIISDEDMQEHLHAVQIGKQLIRIRELLVEQEVDEEMIDAIDQALADNEMFLSSKLDFDGSA